MTVIDSELLSLPILRQELELQPAPFANDGSPSWTLHDPATNRFYQLSWSAFEILSRWHLNNIHAIIETIQRETTLRVNESDIFSIIQFLKGYHLTIASQASDTQHLDQAERRLHLSPTQWLLHHYLSFRLPLVRPMPLLRWLAPKITWAYRPEFWWVVLAIAVLALLLTTRQWDAFTHTFFAYSSWQAAAAIGLALAFAKVLHEFGHACTAYRYGCRIPAMGIAFLVMVPVLYTDTNESWKLSSRRQRVHIGAAGMLAELTLAVFATLLWNFVPESPFRAGLFFLATTTWIATLAINASPFMRFDGYFLLSDALNLPNLHERAFSLTRWWMREQFFGFGEAAPEYFPLRRQRFLIIFSCITWIYRLTLYLSIAFLVYHTFAKALGILLMMVEFGWFIILPVQREFKAWWSRRSFITWNFKMFRLLMVVMLAIGIVITPWQSSLQVPAIIGAQQTQGLYAVNAAIVVQMPLKEGASVKAGQILFQLSSPDLVFHLKSAQTQERMLSQQLEQQPFNASLMQEGVALKRRWQAAVQTINGLKKRLKQLTIQAPFDGILAEINPEISVGGWVATGEKLAHVVNPSAGVKGEAFVDEEDIHWLHKQSTMFFSARQPGTPRLSCRIEGIDDLNVTDLEPYVATVYGGSIPAKLEAGNHVVSLNSVFRVRFGHCAEQWNTQRELPGIASIEVKPMSTLKVWWKKAIVVIQRELGF
ncbi:MAG: HlyD family efflux transporter periplasmic adaptor subunit [Pseudomonadota bacterium]